MTLSRLAETIFSVYGFFCALTLVSGLGAALLVSIFTFFLNRVPLGERGGGVW